MNPPLGAAWEAMESMPALTVICSATELMLSLRVTCWGLLKFGACLFGHQEDLRTVISAIPNRCIAVSRISFPVPAAPGVRVTFK